jgi:putative PIN family toxin of toxin-antitoxin system
VQAASSPGDAPDLPANPARPARVVLDTNVLLDLWVFEDAGVAGLRAHLAAHRLVALRGDACDREVEQVIARASFRFAAERQLQALAAWRSTAVRVADPRPAPLHCRDGSDQKFLDLAFSGGATLLLTKDRALLAVGKRALRLGVQILRPDAPAFAGLAHAL